MCVPLCVAYDGEKWVNWSLRGQLWMWHLGWIRYHMSIKVLYKHDAETQMQMQTHVHVVTHEHTQKLRCRQFSAHATSYFCTQYCTRNNQVPSSIKIPPVKRLLFVSRSGKRLFLCFSRSQSLKPFFDLMQHVIVHYSSNYNS